MCTNPFDEDNALSFVLGNYEEQQALWSVFAEVPTGWLVAFGPAARAACLGIDEKRTDIRPKRMRQRLAQAVGC